MKKIRVNSEIDTAAKNLGLKTTIYYCRSCRKILKESKMGRPTKCKKCHIEYVKNLHARKKSEMSPHRYNQCNDCDRYFAKRRHHGGIYTDPILNESCTACGSKNFEGVEC